MHNCIGCSCYMQRFAKLGSVALEELRWQTLCWTDRQTDKPKIICLHQSQGNIIITNIWTQSDSISSWRRPLLYSLLNESEHVTVCGHNTHHHDNWWAFYFTENTNSSCIVFRQNVLSMKRDILTKFKINHVIDWNNITEKIL